MAEPEVPIEASAVLDPGVAGAPQLETDEEEEASEKRERAPSETREIHEGTRVNERGLDTMGRQACGTGPG